MKEIILFIFIETKVQWHVIFAAKIHLIVVTEWNVRVTKMSEVWVTA